MLKSHTIYLILFSILNLLFVVVSQLVTLLKVGPSSQTDALFAGMTIPTLILTIISTSLTNVLVPLFVAADNPKKSLWEHVYLMLFGGAFFTLVLVLSAEYWVRIIFSGFDQPTLILTYSIIKLQLLALPLSLSSAVFVAYFNSQSRFLIAEFIPALCSVVIFPAIFFAIPKYGVIATSYLFFAKIAFTFIIQFFMFGQPYSLKINLSNLIITFSKMRPLLLGSVYYKSGPVIDRNILSHSASGTMSLFILSQQLLSMGNLILTKAFIVPQITVMNNVANEKPYHLKRWIKNKVLMTLFFSSALFILFVILGQPALNFVLKYYNYHKIDGMYLWLMVVLLFGSFIGDFAATLVSSTFYALGDTKTPSYISMLTYTMFIPLKYITFYFFDIKGLALTVSLYSMINFFILFYIVYVVKLK